MEQPTTYLDDLVPVMRVIYNALCGSWIIIRQVCLTSSTCFQSGFIHSVFVITPSPQLKEEEELLLVTHAPHQLLSRILKIIL